jgi:hypothetical protein
LNVRIARRIVSSAEPPMNFPLNLSNKGIPTQNLCCTRFSTLCSIFHQILRAQLTVDLVQAPKEKIRLLQQKSMEGSNDVMALQNRSRLLPRPIEQLSLC